MYVASDGNQLASNTPKNAARRLPFPETSGEIAGDRLAHRKPRIPGSQRGEFVGIGKASGRNRRVGWQGQARFHKPEFSA
jgi:hypothetical protein